MSIEVLPLLVFVTVATFTPGPGNITSAAMGMLFGYRRSLNFLLGIVSGYLIIMAVCAFISKELMTAIPAVEPALRAFGVCYLLWLAFATARSSYDMDNDNIKPMVFTHGFFLQLLNPKAIVFGLTMYTTFLAPIASSATNLTASVLVLSSMTFLSVSVWTFAGTRIGSFLHVPRIRKTVNAVLVLLLIYCAISLSGVLESSLLV